MAKVKKSYKDLQAEINRLIEQQEAIKDEQVKIFLRPFQTERFKKKMLDIDPVVLREAAKIVAAQFDEIIEDAAQLLEYEQAASEQATIPDTGYYDQPGQ